MVIAWIICEILTVSNVFPNVPGKWGYNARTDTKIYVLQQSDWFRFPYPGKYFFNSLAITYLLITPFTEMGVLKTYTVLCKQEEFDI